MDRPRRRLSAELCAVTLILGCVAATLGTVIQIHRRPPRSRPVPPAAVVVALTPPEEAAPQPDKPQALPTPPPPRVAEKPAEPPEDPTLKIVADLGRAETEQRLETAKAEAQIAALITATRAAKAESDKWKRGVSLTKGQLAVRAGQAATKESQANTAWLERDALAKRRDALKQTLKRDLERPSYAVLPHRGPNGTWQRPIVLECKDETVTLQPKGPTFELVELSLGFSTRNPPFVNTISREAVRIQRLAGPDGKDVIPYIFFIIRPSGIRAYYEARVKLERLGIAFGYELADADWAIDFPDLDQPSTWDGSPPPGEHKNETLATDLSGQHGEGGDGPGFGNGSGNGNSSATGTPGGGRASKEEIDNAFRWPKTPSGMDGRGNGGGGLGMVARGNDGDGNSSGGDGNGTGVGRGFDRAGRRLGGGAGIGTRDGAGGMGNGGGDPLAGEPGGGSGRNGYPGGVDPLAGEPGGGSGPNTNGGDPLGGEPGGGGTRRRSASDEVWEQALRASGGNRPAGLPVGSGTDKPWNRGEAGQPNAPGGPPGSLAQQAAQDGGVSPSEVMGGGPDGTNGSGGNQDATGAGGRPGMNGGSANARGTANVPGTGVGRMVAGLVGNRGTGTGSGTSTGGGGGSSGGSTGTQGSSGSNASNGGTSGGSSGGSSGASSGGSGQPSFGDSSGNPEGGKPGLPNSASSRGGMAGGLTPLSSSIRPLDLVVSCGPKGVAIHPGNYRVTVASLKSKDSLLVPQLKAIVKHKEQASDGKTLAPNIRYVIEPDGAETYATAKSQIVFSGLDWPSSIQINGADQIRLFKTDSW